MAFEIATTDISVIVPSKIENYEDLKSEIEKSLEKYRNLVVTEDAISQAKDDRAKLNKLMKVISDRRISEKKKCLEACTNFEMQCKTLEYLIAAPVSAIDTQIKAFENAEKEKKYDELQEHFNNIECRPEWLTLDRIINKKWANKSESLDSLKKQLETSIKLINSDIEKLNEMYSKYPFYVAVADKYKETLDFKSSAWYGKQLETDYKKIKKSKTGVQNTAEQPTEHSNETIPPELPKAVESDPNMSKIVTGAFGVICKKIKLIALKAFMKSNEIEFSVITSAEDLAKYK